MFPETRSTETKSNRDKEVQALKEAVEKLGKELKEMKTEANEAATNTELRLQTLTKATLHVWGELSSLKDTAWPLL